MEIGSIKDYIEENVLGVGEKCYFNHGEYVYLGLEDNLHVIEKHKPLSGTETHKIETAPFVPKLPLGICIRKKNNHNKLGEITSYTQMIGDLYYKISVYSDVFNGYEHESLDELLDKWEVVVDNPFLSSEEIEEKTSDIDSELNHIEDQISELKRQKYDLDSKRKEITQFCKHDWYKYEEEHVGRSSYKQECVCNICGEEKINSYTKL